LWNIKAEGDLGVFSGLKVPAQPLRTKKRGEVAIAVLAFRRALREIFFSFMLILGGVRLLALEQFRRVQTRVK